MALRVTQQMLYGTVINQNNSALTKLMATNNQMSTEKRINAPSDDPNGAVQVLNTRTNISQLTQYQRNVTSANGWLNQADSTLTSVSTLITSIKEKAQEATTGTVTDENRREIGAQIREYYQQLISLANTTYNGYSLFSGQMTDTPTYVQSLSMTTNDTAFNDTVASNGGFTIAGNADTTVLVQFTEDGTAGNDQPQFTYSTDGGLTWSDPPGTYTTSAGDTVQTLQLGSGLTISIPTTALHSVKGSTDTNDSDGTWMWIRPSAVYQGNTNADVNVHYTGSDSTMVASGGGAFSGNAMVTITSNAGVGLPLTYSYSLDGGATWVKNNTSSAGGPPTTFTIPGEGILTIDTSDPTSPAVGDQFFIQPSSADISIAISPTDSVVVNGVGTEIFGGIDNGEAVAVGGSVEGNLMETVGKLVGYLETNNQGGVQDCLAELTTSQSQVLVAASTVGGRENRVTAASTMITTLQDNANTTLSNVEDADLTTLITTLSEQELAYQAVLKSSSMVMNLSLVSYI